MADLEASSLLASRLSTAQYFAFVRRTGRILTAGRCEVTALGNEMNEAARIEACGSGGRRLASKALIERLSRADADALELDTRHTTHTAARRTGHSDRQSPT